MKYISIIVYILSCILGIFLYITLIPTEIVGLNKTLQFLLLNPVIWISIGVLNMYVMRIFGSSIPNKLLTYIPEKEDIVVNRIASPWFGGLVNIGISMWGLAYIPWFAVIIFSLEDSLLNPTVVQVIILFIAFLPVLLSLTKMYFYLNACLRNVPILVISKANLRYVNSTYSWLDIEQFKRPCKEQIEVILKEEKLAKYKESSSNVFTLDQEEIAENIFELYQRMEAHKKNSLN